MKPLERVERLNLALLECDELLVMFSNADDWLEVDLYVARVTSIRQHLSILIRDEVSTPISDDELKGYDC